MEKQSKTPQDVSSTNQPSLKRKKTDEQRILKIDKKIQKFGKEDQDTEDSSTSLICGDFPTILSDVAGHDITSRYVFGKVLGRGDSGVIYQCTDKFSSDVYACKSISKKSIKEHFVDIENIRREVRIMKHLPHHPNIVTLKETYEDHRNVHIVMDLCKGRDLCDTILARNLHSEKDAALIIKTIVEVVQVCHEHGVMHCDLKPENFVYESKNIDSPLKAIDFGVSVFFKPGKRFNEIVGSSFYMAPEVIMKDYGPEIDIWSAGVILYILLSGCPPFTSDKNEYIIPEILYVSLDFRDNPWPRVSRSAKDLVKRMLDRNVAKRLTSQQVLDHPWILQYVKRTTEVSEVPSSSVV